LSLSIVIPAYNAADYIRAALDSCLLLNSRAKEVIVIDDGSTDDTAAICGGFGRKVRYRRVPNSGVSRARNLGAEMSSGEWLLFLDADDQLEPDGAASLLSSATMAGAGVAYGLVREGRKPPFEPRITGQNHAQGEPPLPAFRNYWRCAVITPGSAVIRRDLHDKIGGFVAGYEPMEDRDYWIKAGLLSSYAHVNRVVLDKTWRPISAGKMNAQRIWNGLRSRLALPRWCTQNGIAWPHDLPRDSSTLLEKAVNEAVYCRCWELVGPLLDECRSRGVRSFWILRAAVEFRLRRGRRKHAPPDWLLPLEG